MGPYCNFCGQRCFTYLPPETPEHILKAYSQGVTIVATCAQGQAFEKTKVGYCLEDIQTELKKKQVTNF